MVEECKFQNGLKIPAEESVRQAVASLRGYIYQVYQSINAWLGIKDDEMLLLEVAEDYAILANDALNSTQVRDTGASGSVTLRSKGVVQTIRSLWNYQNDNPDRSIHINYLTTSRIGREKQFSFPEKIEGLEYWRIAARESKDVEPIRKALLSLNLPKPIIDFIEKASPEDLQNRLLRRIKWLCGAQNIPDLVRAIDDRLINVGQEQGLTPSDVERVRHALVHAVLEKIVDKNDRALTKADLLRVVDKSASISIPLPLFRRLTAEAILPCDWAAQAMSSISTAINVSQIPFPPRIISRRDYVNRVISSMGLSGVLWLYGSSGLGKTITAQLIANKLRRSWWYLSLRDCSGPELNFRLRRVQYSLPSDDFGGFILDDYPLADVNSASISLSMLANEILSRDGLVIVIADKPPPVSLEKCFGRDAPLIEGVPYLSRAEVAEMVRISGGDHEKWAGIIHALCGMGHPQLVDARISGLRKRGWPDSELIAGIGDQSGPVIEVEYERETVRDRLITELPDETREMLNRLTLIIGTFDRKLALSLGSVDPSIHRPGEMLDMLVGPWIEMRGVDQFRISPLISDAGDKNLDANFKFMIHHQIVDHLLTRHPFPAEYLDRLLMHAIVSSHERGLEWLVMAVLFAHEKDLKRISEHLFLLTLLGRGENKLLYPKKLATSVMLRLAQFKIAATADEKDQLEFIADRLIAEARLLEPNEFSRAILFGSILAVLMNRALKIRPCKWMPLLLEVEGNLAHDEGLKKLVEGFDPAKDDLKDWDIPQFLFANRSTALSGLDELTELFAELGYLAPIKRNHLLSSFQATGFGLRLMIDSALKAEHCKGELDGVMSAENYRKLAEVAEEWGSTDLAIECECARAIMLDEYAKDKESALNAIAEAESKYPNNIRLARRRAKVMYRSGDYLASLNIIEPIIDQISKKETVERAHVFREAGISAAKIGDFEKASRLFYLGYEASIELSDILLPMGVGLLADCAISEYKATHFRNAVKNMAHAITEAENTDPQKGPNEDFCIKILGHTVMWMRSQITNQDFGFDFQIIDGCCSNPEPHEDITEMKRPPILFLWYLLAALEADLGIDENVMKHLYQRTKSKKLIGGEIMLNQALMARYIRERDADLFFSYLPEYTSKYGYFIEHKKELSTDDHILISVGDIPVLKSEDWGKRPFKEISIGALLAFSVSLLCSDDFDLETFLWNCGRIDGLGEALSDLLICFEKQPSAAGNMNEQIAAIAGKLANKRLGINTDDLFLVTFHLWDWVRNCHFKYLMENVVSEYLVERWRNVVENQRFLLKQPMIDVPMIRGAINSDVTGSAKIARIVLAAEGAVNHRLSIETRQALKNSRGSRGSRSGGCGTSRKRRLKPA